jgi:hypothetical protein
MEGFSLQASRMACRKDMNDAGGGVIFHGTKDKLICGCYGKEPWLLSDVYCCPETERRVPEKLLMRWIG